MTNELAGRVAVVTGAAGGLGRGIAERFAEAGARVVLADVNAAAGTAVANAIGPNAVFREVDVAEPEQVRDLVRFAVDTMGGLDVMVNNAGVSGAMHQNFLDDDFADFSRVMAINLLGIMVGTQEAARHMAAHGGGSIVNLASIGGITAGRGVITYRASKAGLIQMTKSVAIDLAEHGVRVNCIAPGNIPTGLLASSFSDGDGDARVAAFRAIMAASTPLPREGAAADVAEAALYLASDRSSFLTGVVLPVDGGGSAGNPYKPEHMARIAGNGGGTLAKEAAR
ncbi:NAD(P)-dependent dehydrogenase (short-subunit alcohol dehydrogenase family) [Actinophytocola oryzae]|uniref:NAD(P)-dependent dehydrogenase (Short-subunit alcohol dehydrogenase family) n=2 Tax=Actinophytocola oryzae TaxID=502181 RepID=A0A4R7W1I6_9PSEU|nr:NAD(P)-dependent dehydrogenase (short-subunit alcohol dehydrogenase family) [Actinophytocola oryzae]